MVDESARNQITFRDFCDARHAGDRKEYEQYKAYIERQFETQDKALELATEGLERRLALLNEFRQQSQDESKRFIAREAYEAEHHALEARVQKAEMAQSNWDGRWVAGMVGLTILSIVLKFL